MRGREIQKRPPLELRGLLVRNVQTFGLYLPLMYAANGLPTAVASINRPRGGEFGRFDLNLPPLGCSDCGEKQPQSECCNYQGGTQGASLCKEQHQAPQLGGGVALL
jgi:hypothetical protein